MIKDLFVTCDSDIVMFAGSIAYVPIGTSASSLQGCGLTFRRVCNISAIGISKPVTRMKEKVG